MEADALTFVNNVCNSEAPSQAYAMVYPLTTLHTLFVQDFEHHAAPLDNDARQLARQFIEVMRTDPVEIHRESDNASQRRPRGRYI